MGSVLTAREQLRRIILLFQPNLKARKTVPKYVRVLILSYVGIMSLTLVISTIFYTNESFRQDYTRIVFSANKPVTNVTANVLGYSMLRYGGRRGASSFSYAYGFSYAIGGQTYYGTGSAVQTVPGDYEAYKPLPRSAVITVNTNDPKQFSYVTGHYGLGSYANFGIFFYILFLGVFCALGFGKGLGTGPQFAKFSDYVPLFAGIIVMVLPVYYAVTANVEIYNGDVSRNITGYNIVHKNTKSFYETNGDASHISAEYDYGNDKGRAYSLKGMRDTQIRSMFIRSPNGKERNIEFEYKYNDKYIIMYEPEDTPMLNDVIYAVSDTGKYAIPLAILEYEFDYKGT